MIRWRVATLRALLAGVAMACATGGARRSAAEPCLPQSGGLRDHAGERSFFAAEVSRPAALRSGPQSPQKPSVPDSALVQFVVDTAGLPDARTLLFLKPSGDEPTREFAAYVQSVVASERFTPAVHHGAFLVRQFVQQPIVVR